MHCKNSQSVYSNYENKLIHLPASQYIFCKCTKKRNKSRRKFCSVKGFKNAQVPDR